MGLATGCQKASQGLDKRADLTSVGADQIERYPLPGPCGAEMNQAAATDVIGHIERRLVSNTMPCQRPTPHHVTIIGHPVAPYVHCQGIA